MSKQLTILVTGGAGYIGSHFVNQLRKRNNVSILVVDNFYEPKNRANVLHDEKITYCKVDLCDKAALTEVFEKYPIDAVVHYAAIANVPDSLKDPGKYYQNNIVGGLNLLDRMLAYNIKKIIFSSSASVYGEPQTEVIRENHPKNPINPYGYSKLIFEHILQDFHYPYGLQSVSFRYFCASGCDESGLVGEYHDPETHVIPAILNTILGKREKFFVYGNTFNTPDGTGVRDYIHVNDLASAHARALDLLLEGKTICEQYNLGINKGFSVLELIAAVEKVTGKKLPYEFKESRPGDPSRLIADSSKAQSELDWQPKYQSIEEVIATAYNFFRKL